MKNGKKNPKNPKTSKKLKLTHKQIFQIYSTVVVVVVVILIALGVKVVTDSKKVPETAEVSNVEGETFHYLVPLKVNAYPQVNELILKYYTALATGDEETIRSLRDNTDETILLQYDVNGNYVESYSNMVCYTKDGLQEGSSWVVYVYYETRFKGQAVALPGVTPLYVYTTEDGRCLIHDYTYDQEVIDHIIKTSTDEDVILLYSQVNWDYMDILQSNEQMMVYLNDFVKKSHLDVGQALVDMKDQGTLPEDGPVGNQITGAYRAKEALNIRAQADESSERLDVCYSGGILEVQEHLDNGWTKVMYNGQEGYVKTELLK